MNTAVISIILLGIVIAGIYVVFKARMRRASPSAAEKADNFPENPFPRPIARPEAQSGDFELLDERGTVFIAGKELVSMPVGGTELPPTEGAGKLLTHLASDIFKGTVSIPGKTLEVVFKPEIQAGLRDGSLRLMKTNSGEALADAVSTASGKVAGKGRVIQTGQVKQLAAGAFQLVSIAVAQSHLADIERSLTALKGGINQVLDNMEAADVASIKGGIGYLEAIADLVKSNGHPEQLSVPIQVTIAQLVASSNVWREKLFEDVRNLTTRIDRQVDLDTWGGTENTYKALLSHAEATDKLAKRQDLYMNFVKLLDFLLVYIDPLKAIYVRPQIDAAQWEALIEALKNSHAAKANGLIKARFNSVEILEARRDKINRRMDDFVQLGTNRLRSYAEFSIRLSQQLDSFISAPEGVRLAVQFDDAGKVKKAMLM